MQPTQCDLQPPITKDPRTTHTHDEPRIAKDRARSAHEVPFIAPAETTSYTEKHKRFLAPASSPNKARATLIQPLQCVLQKQVYIHAAITMRSAITDSKAPYNYAHTTNQALQNTIREPITHQSEQTAPAVHTRYLSSWAETTSYGKNKVSCSGFLPQKSNAI